MHRLLPSRGHPIDGSARACAETCTSIRPREQSTTHDAPKRSSQTSQAPAPVASTRAGTPCHAFCRQPPRPSRRRSSGDQQTRHQRNDERSAPTTQPPASRPTRGAQARPAKRRLKPGGRGIPERPAADGACQRRRDAAQPPTLPRERRRDAQDGLLSRVTRRKRVPRIWRRNPGLAIQAAVQCAPGRSTALRRARQTPGEAALGDAAASAPARLSDATGARRGPDSTYQARPGCGWRG